MLENDSHFFFKFFERIFKFHTFAQQGGRGEMQLSTSNERYAQIPVQSRLIRNVQMVDPFHPTPKKIRINLPSMYYKLQFIYTSNSKIFCEQASTSVISSAFIFVRKSKLAICNTPLFTSCILSSVIFCHFFIIHHK